MAIVWPCTLSVDTYAATGRDVECPVLACPGCAVPMGPWSGYWRFVRHAGSSVRIFVPRGRCAPCATTHALLPAFCLLNRLDSMDTIGPAVAAVVGGSRGVRPVAEAIDVAHSTARGWVRRFAGNSARLATGFAALAVELGGVAVVPVRDGPGHALAAIAAAWRQAMGLPGWLAVGRWRFCSSVCGGSLLAINTNSPYLVVGRRRFMPPVP